MKIQLRQIVTFAFVAACLGSGAFAQHPTMPPGMTHEEHLAQMQKDAELKKRGAAAMGFDQDATTHHFRLYETGGAIEVIANQAADQSMIQQVRTHLKDIAAEFARGDFSKAIRHSRGDAARSRDDAAATECVRVQIRRDRIGRTGPNRGVGHPSEGSPS